MKPNTKTKPTEERILDKLDSIDTRLSSIDVTLARQNVTLEEHIKRTKMLEEEIKPIKKNMAMLEGVMKFLVGAGILSAMAASIIKILEIFRK